MTTTPPSSIQTRASLLRRLQEGDDIDAWQEFTELYGRLIRDFAHRSGLTESEAEEVAQETAIGVARHLPGFVYDPEVCRFKSWLLNLARWRIQDQFRKHRQPGAPAGAAHQTPAPLRDPDRTATIERVPDPGAPDLEELFEREWQENLVALALQRVKRWFSLKQLQVFDLTAVKGWPCGEVAKALGLTLTAVYVTKHRVAARLKKEVRRLEQEAEQNALGNLNRHPRSS